VINVFNKIDLLKEEELLELKKNFERPSELLAKIKTSTSGMLTDIILNLSKIIGLRPERFINVSCTQEENFQLLQDVIYEVYCICGDLT
jgi:50S ribosomal subunit-associated GTPase HflX